LWWFERRRRGSTAGVDARPKERPAKPDASAVKQACRANEPAQARQALLAWGRASWPDSPPTGLAELARRLGDDAARDTLIELDAVLYASRPQTWNGGEAWKRLGKVLKTPKNRGGRTRAEALPALYPASRTT